MGDNRALEPIAPALIVVDDDEVALERTAEELRRRYAADYRIVAEHSADTALAELERMAVAGEDVALVLADQWMPALTGAELLGRLQRLHPNTKPGHTAPCGVGNLGARQHHDHKGCVRAPGGRGPPRRCGVHEPGPVRP